MTSSPLNISQEEYYEIYVDTTFLIDLTNQTSKRHSEAKRLMRLFEQHTPAHSSTPIRIKTGSWAVAEAHSVLYEIKLKEKGVKKQNQHKKLRDNLPPDTKALEDAMSELSATLGTLSSKTQFQLLQPNSEVLALVTTLVEKAAIWPADAIHLAQALTEGCSMLITDDIGFMDKIDYCQNNVIIPYRQDTFQDVIDTMPPFDCYGLDGHRRHVDKTPRETAWQALQKANFSIK